MSNPNYDRSLFDSYIDRVSYVSLSVMVAIAQVIILGFNKSIIAQIIPDETLGAESSLVTPDHIKGIESDRISGGAARGSNLFHSFREFNIGEGKGGYFENPTAIENIFSRVTGNNSSEILGRLGVLGDANLFFMNPNGILFGRNASLDLRGSFLATTADSIVFPDGNQFSVTNPEAPPLLTVNVKQPIGLEFEGREGIISHQGILAVEEDLTLSAGNLDLQGQLKAGRNLTLKAQDTVSLRDSATEPFLAEAGRELLVQGEGAIDLSGLNNRESELVSGRDLIFRSPKRFWSDNAIYTTGGIFRTEQLDGKVVDFFIPHERVIKANGDVSLEAYSGSSLYILAGGSVTVKGDVTITDSQPASVPKEFTTADGTTILVQSSDRPTLDVRAGIDWQQLPGGLPGNIASDNLTPTFANSATNADITAGGFDNKGNFVGNQITNNGGSVFLTNQYQPNPSLTGDINFGFIDTSSSSVGLRDAEDGGNIALNASSNISSTGDLSSYSRGNGGNGGNIILSAGSNIKTGNLNSSSSSFSSSYSYSGNSSSGNGGNGGNIILSASDYITTGNLYSFSYSSSSGNAGNGGNIVLLARDGDITGNKNITGSVFASFSVSGSETGKAGTGGNVFLEAKNNITNLEILTLSSDSQSGSFQLKGLGDLSITDTKILTSKQLKVKIPTRVEPITLSVGEAGQSGDVEITSSGNLTFNNSSIESDTKGSDPAGNIMIASPGSITFKNSGINTNTSSTGAAGIIKLSADEGIEITGSDSGLLAQTAGKGKAGNINIDTPQLIIDQGASISAFTEASGDGGTISIDAPQALLLTDNSKLTVETSAAGQPGNIFITTPNLTIGKDAEISATATATSTNKEGGGSITINTSNLDLTGKLGIFAETQGESSAGTLKIQPYRDNSELNIKFTDTAIISSSTTSSGTGGDINLTAPETINLSGKGKVTVETRGSGNAGSIDIETKNLNISNQTEISASTSGRGEAGDLNITAANFNLLEGAKLSTNTDNTESNVSAGDIQLNITDSINLSGSSIRAGTSKGSEGNGGNILIDPATMIIQDGAEIAVDSQGKGIGGDIILQAGLLTLDEGKITAETASNQGGDITLTLSDLLQLRNHSEITATAGNNEAGGNGGNIIINTPFIISSPFENNDITADAFAGNGGNITINSNGILGIEYRPQKTALSDITASSRFGQQGAVEINTSGINPTRELTNLPEETVEFEVAEGCQGETREPDVAFYDIGRGGLPPRLDEPFRIEALIVPLIPFDVERENETVQTGEEIFTISEMKGKFWLTPACRDQ